MSASLQTVSSERELLATFRPRDRKDVEVLRGMQFPLRLDEKYLAWSDPHGVHSYLVFQRESTPQLSGLVFTRDHGSANSPARMCEWCHSMGPSDQIGMLTVRISTKRIVGVLLCLDLSCQEKLQTVSQMTGQKVSKLTHDMYERMDRFFDRVWNAKPEEKAE